MILEYGLEKGKRLLKQDFKAFEDLNNINTLD